MTRSTSRPNEPPLPAALAYFLTWTTYGSWLPGDARQWTDRMLGKRPPSRAREADASRRMSESMCVLIDDQRQVVESTITEHCRRRGWELLALNCRTNDVHVVVVAGSVHPKQVRIQLMAWCTRKLKEMDQDSDLCGQPVRQNWWTERGSERFLNDEGALAAAIQ